LNTFLDIVFPLAQLLLGILPGEELLVSLKFLLRLFPLNLPRFPPRSHARFSNKEIFADLFNKEAALLPLFSSDFLPQSLCFSPFFCIPNLFTPKGFSLSSH